MKATTLTSLIIALAAIFFVACSTTATPMTPSELEGEWSIIEVGGMETVGETPPFIGLNIKEGRIYGSNSCNRINGLIDENKEQKAGILSFGKIASTMMFCANSPMEQQIMDALKKVKQYSATDDNGVITLLDTNTKPLMKIKRKGKDVN